MTWIACKYFSTIQLHDMNHMYIFQPRFISMTWIASKYFSVIHLHNVNCTQISQHDPSPLIYSTRRSWRWSSSTRRISTSPFAEMHHWGIKQNLWHRFLIIGGMQPGMPEQNDFSICTVFAFNHPTSCSTGVCWGRIMMVFDEVEHMLQRLMIMQCNIAQEYRFGMDCTKAGMDGGNTSPQGDNLVRWAFRRRVKHREKDWHMRRSCFMGLDRVDLEWKDD